MARRLNRGLKPADWPQTDRERLNALSDAEDIFDDAPWSKLSQSTIRNRRYGYGQFLGFLQQYELSLLRIPPEERVTRDIVRAFVEQLRRNCTDTAVAIVLQRLRLTIAALAPKHDWTWLYRIERRIARSAIRARKPRATSADLYQIGLDLIQDARNKSGIFSVPVLSQAEQFRDGLMIAVLVEAPMRRACFAGLELEEHVVKIGDRWNIFVPAEMTKTGEAQDYLISVELGVLLEEYLDTYRPVFPEADQHLGLWPYENRPMTDKMVRRYIRKHTEQRLGVAISPHGFRRGAASFIAQADPSNIRMAKDLLGHTTFAMTEKHYIHSAGSRIAGDALAEIIAEKSVR